MPGYDDPLNPGAPGAESEAGASLDAASREGEPRGGKGGTEPSRGLLPSITLPTGGGAIRGVDEKFATNLATGAGTMSVPIFTSPGRQGVGVSLSVGYSSGAGNGPWGIGWDLSIPAITRKTDKGLPRYADGEDSDIFLLSGAEDLVPIVRKASSAVDKDCCEDDRLSGQFEHFDRGEYRVRRYRPRTEGLFARIERWTQRRTGDVHWQATTRDNMLSVYGRSEQARLSDPRDPRRVFSWLLEETRDDRGNAVRYTYKAEDGEGVDAGKASEHHRFEWRGTNESCFRATAQRYIKRIQYGNRAAIERTEPLSEDPGDWHFEVVFDYGEHDAVEPTTKEQQAWLVRQDAFSVHRATFELRTYRLCRRVLMFHRFPELGAEPLLVRSTDFGYDEGPVVSYLTRGTQVGYLRSDATGELERAESPSVEFDYLRPKIHDKAERVDRASLEGITGGVSGQRAQWVDLDGEGIPGVLIPARQGWLYKSNRGAGELAPPKPLRTLPHPSQLGGVASAQLTDLGSDGQLDLVLYGRATGGALSGFFERTEEGGFSPFVPFQAVPKLNWNDPNLRFVDLDGDGHPDVLITEHHAYTWFRSRSKKGLGPGGVIPTAKDEDRGPAVVFNDGSETIHLADMSGDGLVDIVRVRNGDVCYWPNLGYGHFGRKVTFDHSPRFDSLDQFDPKRLRFADVDGSGTSDILYLGREGICIYFNKAGNALSRPTLLHSLPPIDSLSTLDVVDLLGTGTATLVWSTPLGSEARRRVTYVDLMGGQKPHLLHHVVNNLGAETRIHYAPSTKFYLEDKKNGTPWLTRLPFPVQVVERVESFDRISQSRLVTTHSYHHGFYDGVEREFHGFARVEKRDTEEFIVGEDTELFQPPVRTVSWFHTGAYLQKETFELGLQKEYFRGGPSELLLPDTILPQGLCYEDARQATRALRGSLLRQEVYAEDGNEKSGLPYLVTEQNVEVRRLQSSELAPQGLNREIHGVFFVHPRQTVTVHTERNPDDPRVVHAFTLDVDDFGNVTREVSLAYARRNAPYAEQARPWATLNETEVINQANETDWYRIGVQFQTKSFEVTGLALPEGGKALLPIAELRAALDALDPSKDLPFDAEASGTGPERRLLSQAQQLFTRNDLSGPLPLGTIESLALPFESYQLALTAGQVEGLIEESQALSGAPFDPAILLAEGRYVQRDGLNYWTTSGRVVFDPTRFYLPIEAIDPFGAHFFVTYDEHALLVTEARDPIGNLTRADIDYRVLAPRLMTDPNLNRTAVAFDALGMVVATAVMGKEGAGEGDTLEEPTTRLKYDLLRFQREQEPSFVHTFAREEHGSQNTRFQETYTYSDGFGRVVMQKVQAEPGEAPRRTEEGELERDEDGRLVFGHLEARWVGTGRTVFNNKGSPVKQYEPFFSSTPAFESEDELVRFGVTPLLFYDPLGRVIRTELPDGTESRGEFDVWQTTAFDPNDAIEGTRWLEERLALPAGSPGRRAAELALRDANTPTVTHLDTLGRPFLVVSHNRSEGEDEFFQTRSELDVQSNVLSITDARGNVVIRQRYDALARGLRVDSVDAGVRLTVGDIAGKPLRAWDSRGHILRAKYDALQRPTHSFVEEAGSERLIQRLVYGEALDPPVPSTEPAAPSPAQERNLRGQVLQSYDSARLAESELFDFKANLQKGVVRLVKEYKTEPDWRATDALTDPAAILAIAAPLLEEERFEERMTYDALNRISSATTPDGSVTRPTYNEANFLEQLHVAKKAAAEQPVINNLDYNARGQRTLCEHASPLSGEVSYRIEYSYDPETFRLTRLVTRRASDSVVLQDLRYTHDPVGNIVELQDRADTRPVFGTTKPVSGDGKYEYDALYRLVRAEGREHPGQQPSEDEPPPGALPHPGDLQALTRYVERYFYDAVGNIEQIQHRPQRGASSGAWTRKYQYASGSNRLLATSLPTDPQGILSAKYSYDAHGSMTSMPHLEGIDWDYADRMKHVNKGGGGDVFFTYDGAGQRVRKIWEHSGLVEERLYLGGYEVYRRRRGDTLELERETLHLMDGARRVAMIETKTIDPEAQDTAPLSAPRWRFQLENLLGSAVLELNETGQVISYEEYHPYGSTAFHSVQGRAEVSAKRYRYTGKEKDEETGLYYHGARYYAPWLGRWTAADPAGLVDGLNLYRYSRNNPVLYSDPSGTLGTTQREEELGMSLPEEHPDDPSAPTAREEQAQQSLPENERYLPPDEPPLAPTARPQSTGRVIEPPPPVSPPDPLLYVPQGAIYTQYQAADREWQNPDNPAWARGTFFVLAVAAGPLALAEEYVARPIANIPYVVHNAGIGIGEHAGRAYLWTQQDEYGEAALESLYVVRDASTGFVAAASVAAPIAGALESRASTVVATEGGGNVVYRSVDAAGSVNYVGITNNLARRSAEHLRTKGIQIEKLMGNLSRSDARAVEQALIEIHGLGKHGGTLLNKINSISPNNPVYASQLARGHALLKSIGY